MSFNSLLSRLRGEPVIRVIYSNLSKKKRQAAINFAIRAWKRYRRDPHANTLIANCIVSEMSAQYKFTWKCICGRDFSVDISADCSDATTSKRKRRYDNCRF
ncbi:dynein light chain type 1 domain-containing protein [Ditylenchus destructor]|nr:dynein light chain type 1 domain-containing protein [Ditylenchus destructor]